MFQMSVRQCEFHTPKPNKVLVKVLADQSDQSFR